MDNEQPQRQPPAGDGGRVQKEETAPESGAERRKLRGPDATESHRTPGSAEGERDIDEQSR